MALTPAELHTLINLDLTDELQGQNSAARLREVLHAIVGSLSQTQTSVTQVNPVPSVGAPAAPTAAVVDDAGNTFSVALVPGYASLADYEVFGVPGQAGVVSAAAAADVQAGRLYLRGLTGNLAVGAVGVRVAASGNRPAGGSATNATAFTSADGAAAPGTPTGGTVAAPSVALTVAPQANGTYKYSATATSSATVTGITIRVLLAADGSEVASYGPSGSGSTSYITTRPALAAGDYLAVATATTASSSGSSDEVPFTVAGASGTQVFASPFAAPFA